MESATHRSSREVLHSYPVISIYLFGDQSEDARSYLRVLLQEPDHDPLLSHFLSRSFDAVRTELDRITGLQGKCAPRFLSLLGLLSSRTNGTRNTALEHAITTICHFALFFKKCQRSRGFYPQCANSYLIGICTGALAAAAISCCHSLSELLPIAVQVVVLSFRAGALAADLGARLQTDGDFTEQSWSWAFMCPDLSVDHANAILNTFSESRRIPLVSRPYISSSSPRGVTICGPSIYLSKFLASELSGIKVIPLPIYSLYHAPHLYSIEDIESLLDTLTLSELEVLYRHLPVLLSGVGGSFEAGNLRHALCDALSEIFLRPMQWQSMIQALTPIFKSSEDFKAVLIPLASSAALSLQGALKSSSAVDLTITTILPQNPDHQSSHSNDSRQGSTISQDNSRPKIAIVGISGRFPNADTTSKLWDILHKGLDVHKVVPATRWNVETHVDTSGKQKNTSATPYGCWVDEAGLFDARFFGMSPREALQVDPAQRLALMASYEALEQGGIVPDSTPSSRRDRIGVAYGVTSNDWMETNSAQDIDSFFIPGGNRAFIPGRINYHFKISGPSYAIDTACSSSMAAIHIACNALWRGEADTMIAGGTNILTNPDFTAGLDRGHFLSRTGNCRTFDDEADGYCCGEGVGAVILKRLEDALADNDPIQAVILNVRTNHSAEAESITRPYLGAQKAIFHDVLDGIDPVNVSYIEMHGTGTQVGDATEMASVLDTFAPTSGHQQRPKTQPLYIGSVKANVGHGEAAAGITGLAKLLLMMKHNIIPPHCGIKTRINHRFPVDMRARNVHIAQEPVAWTKPSKGPRRALLNNFSAAGGNSTLLLEDAPPLDRKNMSDPRTCHVVVVSAKVLSSLEANAKSLLSVIQNNHAMSLTPSDVSYTTSARRIHHSHRIAATGSSLEEIAINLSRSMKSQTDKSNPVSKPKVTFAFTGQGSLYVEMGKQLYNNIPSFRTDINRYDQMTRNQGFPSFMHVIVDEEGDAVSYSSMVMQLTTTCLQMALVRLWQSWGITPQSVIGHSLGFYASLNAAGVLSEADTIYLVGARAQLIQDKCQPDTHMMLAVKASPSTIAPIWKEKDVKVACINSPDDTILSGLCHEIMSVQTELMAKGFKAMTLSLPYAFHSSQIDCILRDFRSVANGVIFHQPLIPLICTLTTDVIQEPGIVGPDYLVNHCRKTVNMVDALEAATRCGLITKNTVFVEVGPNSTMSSMLQATLKSQYEIIPSRRRGEGPWRTLARALAILYAAGANIDWKAYHSDFIASQQVIPLPHYNWDLKDYWIQYLHDWSLRKGNPVINTNLGSSVLSTAIHEVLNEDVKDMRGSAILQSDLNRSDLHSIVQGHKVDGIPLCTPSIYADMALSIGKYLREKYNPTMEENQITIADMTVEKALIVQAEGPQYLRTIVKIELSERKAYCKFLSVDNQGDTIVHHASCTILYTCRPEAQWFRDHATETRLQIAHLRQGLVDDRCYKFNQTMIYRMVATLADFDKAYRGLQEIFLDDNALAAATKINFSKMNHMANATFNINPAYLDAFSQSAGFVMNANGHSDPEVECFVNHGWGSLQMYKALQSDVTYESYVQMVRKEGSSWQGNLTIICEDEVIGLFGDITLVKIISEESGINKSELHDDTTFADIGIDSLLSLIITSRLKEELDFQAAGVGSGAGFTIFDQFSTLGQLKATIYPPDAEQSLTPVLLETLEHEESPSTLATSDDSGQRSLQADYDIVSSKLDAETLAPEEMPATPHTQEYSEVPHLGEQHLQGYGESRPCSSIRLQGPSLLRQPNSESHHRNLFLFPDGSGSASSYASLPTLSQFPSLYPRNGLKRLPKRFYEHCRNTGVFGKLGNGSKKDGEDLNKDSQLTSERYDCLIQQFNATIDLLSTYHATPLEASPKHQGQHLLPRVSLAWASERTFDGIKFPKIEEKDIEEKELIQGMRFLTDERTDFGPGGWGELIEGIRVEVLEGLDHFGIMYGEGAKALAGFIERAMTEGNETEGQTK